MYRIHVEDLTVNNDGFLVWNYWLIVFSVTDIALISMQQFRIGGQGMGGEKN